jgi:hypothetical protein
MCALGCLGSGGMVAGCGKAAAALDPHCQQPRPLPHRQRPGELLKRQVHHLLRRQPHPSRMAKTDVPFDTVDKVV